MDNKMGMKLLKRFNVVLVGMLTILFAMAFCAKSVQAAESNTGRDVSDSINNISVVSDTTNKAESKYADGTKLKVTATFAASHGSHGSFKENDQITVSWTLAKPEDKDKAYVEGFPDGMDLKIEGQVVGHYSVTPNGTVLTFNKNIENFPNKQSGDFTFYVTARNLKSEDQTLEIIYDKTKVVPITVAGTPKRQDPEPTGEGWGGEVKLVVSEEEMKNLLFTSFGEFI